MLYDVGDPQLEVVSSATPIWWFICD